MGDELLENLRFCANLHSRVGYRQNGKIFAEAADALEAARKRIAELEEAEIVSWEEAANLAEKYRDYSLLGSDGRAAFNLYIEALRGSMAARKALEGK